MPATTFFISACLIGLVISIFVSLIAIHLHSRCTTRVSLQLRYRLIHMRGAHISEIKEIVEEYKNVILKIGQNTTSTIIISSPFAKFLGCHDEEIVLKNSDYKFDDYRTMRHSYE